MHASWIVEGANYASFSFANIVAQLLADTGNRAVQVICENGAYCARVLVKIVQPKTQKQSFVDGLTDVHAGSQ